MTMRCVQPALLIAFLVALAPSPARASQRYTIDLGAGRFVVIDNASQMSRDSVQNLVIAADRSTATDCPYDQTPAGFLRSGDRVCVTDNYIAWFDHTVNNNWARSGELAGLWTLNPETNYPRYFRTNTCSNWAHNELLPGSASPFGQVWFWDTQSPPVEHVVMATAPACFFGAVHYAQLPGTGANWALTLDGASYTDGVHYKVTTRLTDGSSLCDLPGEPLIPTSMFGGAWIDSELEYICRPRDILSVWKFKPSTTITAANTFTYVWTAYSLDQDGTLCDALTATDDWPDTFYGQPLFARSNKPLTTNWTMPQVTYPPGSIVPMEVGSACPYEVPNPDPHNNRDIYSFAPEVGDTLEWGEAPNLDPSVAPRLTMTLLDSPPGTQRVQYDQIQFANETFDGVLGAGPKRNASHQYFPDTWYGDTFALSTFGDSGSARGDFNHDGKSEIVVQNTATKAVQVWYMNGVQREEVLVPTPAQPGDANWELVSTADFNNDNKPDFLWRNSVTAKAVNWFMNNDLARCAGGFAKPDQAQDSNWVVKGSGDFGQVFGQDGRPDIVWQNLTSHRIVIWTMKYSPIPPYAPSDGCPPPGMGSMGESARYAGNFVTPDPAADQVVGAVDDFNLDGYADLVLENNAGQVQLWLMNGLARTSVLNLSFGGLGGNPNWRVVGAGYFNEDQAPDILWRNSSTGQLKVWFMDRTNPVYTVDIVDENFNLAYAPAPLNVVGPR